VTADLVAFLRQRLDEDEAAALPFRNPLGEVRPWRCDEIGGKVREVGPSPFGLPDVISESDTHLTAEHIARHDPARVLADVQAKRAMLPHLVVEGHPLGYCDRCMCLRLLASVWADHAEFDPSWKW